MNITDILNDSDYKTLKNSSNFLGNPDCDILDEILLDHALALDIHDYALLRLSYTLHNIEGTLNRIEEYITNN